MEEPKQHSVAEIDLSGFSRSPFTNVPAHTSIHTEKERYGGGGRDHVWLEYPAKPAHLDKQMPCVNFQQTSVNKTVAMYVSFLI